jgi:UDP-glucose 4-epimerase
MKRIHIISGSCGFIGHKFTEDLLKKGEHVVGIDIFRFKTFHLFRKLKKYENFKFYKIDLSKKKIFNKIKINRFKLLYFWHFAANSDIQLSSKKKKIDYNDTYLTTINFLNLAKKFNAKFFFFSSSSAVYGKKNSFLKETDKNLKPISNYGRMKLRSEKIILNEKKIPIKIIFRYPNVIGKHLTHGVIYDFIKKSKLGYLKVLGNGTQSKPYIRLNNLIKIILKTLKIKKSGNYIFNIGPNKQGTNVKFIVREFIKKNKKIKNNIYYEKKKIGWKGDINKVRFLTEKMKSFFKTKSYNSNQEVRDFFKYDYN